jgi:hypothetical protein
MLVSGRINELSQTTCGSAVTALACSRRADQNCRTDPDRKGQMIRTGPNASGGGAVVARAGSGAYSILWCWKLKLPNRRAFVIKDDKCDRSQVLPLLQSGGPGSGSESPIRGPIASSVRLSDIIIKSSDAWIILVG